MEVCGQLHSPANLTPGKELLVPIRQETRWVPEHQKNSNHLPEFEPPIIQPVAQCYTTELARILQGLNLEIITWRHFSQQMNITCLLNQHKAVNLHSIPAVS
jgi:hypothetical protein